MLKLICTIHELITHLFHELFRTAEVISKSKSLRPSYIFMPLFVLNVNRKLLYNTGSFSL
jgi:hypothetical protein